MYQKKGNELLAGGLFITLICVFVVSHGLAVGAKDVKINFPPGTKLIDQISRHSSPEYDELAATSAQAGMRSSGYGKVKKQLKDYFQLLTDLGKFNGTVLIAQEGKVLLKKGFGMADFDNGIPNNPETVFAVASLTKAFTSMSIMMLEERGLLSVNDTVKDHIPEFPGGETMTLHQLLTHTSGMYELYNDPNSAVLAYLLVPQTPEQLLGHIVGNPPEFESGARWEYCNTGFVVLGIIVERVSGLSFRDFLRINIFEPLGMKHTSYDPTFTEFENKRAVPYDVAFPEPIPTIYLHPTFTFSAGGIYSTVKDLYKWDQALYTNQLVSYETITRIFTPDLGDYGYGWWVDQVEVNGEAHNQVWHWGGYVGYQGLLARFVDDELTILLLQNTHPVGDVVDEQIVIRDGVLHIIFGNQ